jgi:hypothetical protein
MENSGSMPERKSGASNIRMGKAIKSNQGNREGARDARFNRLLKNSFTQAKATRLSSSKSCGYQIPKH